MAYFCNGKKGICTEAYEDCEDCGYFSGTGGHRVQAVTTNADHIRSMTDEELAELFAGMCQSNIDGESHCDACLLNAWCPACGYEDDWLEWLQQPCKEETK